VILHPLQAAKGSRARIEVFFLEVVGSKVGVTLRDVTLAWPRIFRNFSARVPSITQRLANVCRVGNGPPSLNGLGQHTLGRDGRRTESHRHRGVTDLPARHVDAGKEHGLASARLRRATSSPAPPLRFHNSASLCSVSPMTSGRFAIVVGLVWGGTAAAADDSHHDLTSVRLLYQRDASAPRCPDEATLRAAVAKRVGFDPFEEMARRFISCRVYRTGRALRARIEVGDSSDEPPTARELVSQQADCQELAEAIELALTIAVDPLSVAEPTRVEPAPATAPPAATPSDMGARGKPVQPASPTVAPPTVAPPIVAPPTVALPTVTATPSPPRRRAFEMRLGVRAQAAAGLDPGMGYAGTIHLGLKRAWLSTGLELRVLAPSSLEVGRGSLRVWQWAILLAPCAHRGAWAACLLGSAGMIYGRSEGLAINGQSSSASTAAGARGAWEYPLYRESLRFCATLDLAGALTRTHFTVAGTDAWATPPVGAVFGAGVHGVFF